MSIEHDVFTQVIDILKKLDIPYMIGGSVAAIAYGEARLTLDLDLVINIDERQAKEFSRAFGPEYYVDPDSILEAIKTRGHFNIIQSEKGIKVDFYVLQGDEFSQEEFSRKRKESFDEEREASFASPEDVILKKLEWHKMGASQKHLEDVMGMLRISGNKLDYKYIDKWAIKIGVQDVWQKVKNGLQI